MNICGCLVHSTRERAEATKFRIDEIEGAEVRGSDDDGRFVVVVEDTADRLASEIIMDLHQISGVVSVTLTYHHFEDARPSEARKTHVGGQIA